MYLIKNVCVYDPEPAGVCDVFIGGGRILKIGQDLSCPLEYEIQVIDGTGRILFPGLIDLNAPILGDGTEEGPEMESSVFLKNAITTVVGSMRSEDQLFSMKNLISRTGELRKSGLNAFCLTGSYLEGFRSLQDSILDDLLLLDMVIGVGEISFAKNDRMEPSREEMKKALTEMKIAGNLSGKKTAMILSVGSDEAPLYGVREWSESVRMPASSMLPVHVNCTAALLEDAVRDLKDTGRMIGLSVWLPENQKTAVSASKALRMALDAGADPRQIILTSNGIPDSNPSEERENKKDPVLFYRELVSSVQEEQIPLEKVLKTVTVNPAQLLGMKSKGRIRQGYDADLILAHRETFSIENVFLQGKMMEICLDKMNSL